MVRRYYYDDWDDGSVLGCLILIYIGSVILCIYSFITANANNGNYHGTLLSAHAAQSGSKYYVVETFAKNGGNDTCDIRRLNAYSDYSYASNMADAVIVGTTRKIWETYNNPHDCYDIALRNYWNLIGGLSLIIVALPLVIVFCFGIEYIYEKYKWTRTPTPIHSPIPTHYHTHHTHSISDSTVKIEDIL